jgi:hypothetical protein
MPGEIFLHQCELLFKAHAEPGIVAQWMGTKVLKHESKKHRTCLVCDLLPLAPAGVQTDIIIQEVLH